jgi:hypothetical protein
MYEVRITMYDLKERKNVRGTKDNLSNEVFCVAGYKIYGEL